MNATDGYGQLSAEAIKAGWQETRRGPNGEAWSLTWDAGGGHYRVYYGQFTPRVYRFASLYDARRSFDPLVAGEEPWNQQKQ